MKSLDIPQLVTSLLNIHMKPKGTLKTYLERFMKLKEKYDKATSVLCITEKIDGVTHKNLPSRSISPKPVDAQEPDVLPIYLSEETLIKSFIRSVSSRSIKLAKITTIKVLKS